MPQNLKTEWKIWGRSGDTVDGRKIPEEAIIQAAETYDPKIFCALVWPEHQRWANFGTVVEVKYAKNEEGGVDLLGRLTPNDFYIATNRAGQRLFTSMELTPDFRKTGKWYLTGLAATDNPASVATSEMRLSANNNTEVFKSQFIESNIFQQEEYEATEQGFINQLLQFFNKRFPEDESAMNNEQYTAITTQLSSIAKQLETFGSKIVVEKDVVTDNDSTSAITLESLASKITELSEQVKAFKATPEGEVVTDPDNTVSAEEFNKLSEEFKKLTEQFEAATKEQPGTDAGEQGGGINLSAVL